MLYAVLGVTGQVGGEVARALLDHKQHGAWNRAQSPSSGIVDCKSHRCFNCEFGRSDGVGSRFRRRKSAVCHVTAVLWLARLMKRSNRAAIDTVRSAVVAAQPQRSMPKWP
jgi:hypothetical protein